MKIIPVVFDKREGLRFFFISTLDKKRYFLSLNIKDIIYLFYGIYVLIPPLKKSHIRVNFSNKE